MKRAPCVVIKTGYILRRLLFNNRIIEFLVIVIPNRVIGETAIIIIWEIDRSRILLFLTISK